MMNKLVPISLAIATVCSLVVSTKLTIKEAKLPCERLPFDVVPSGYQLELEFKSLESETYRGHVNISLSSERRILHPKYYHDKDSHHKKLLKGLLDETCKLSKFGSDSIVLHADSSIELKDVAVISTSHGLRSLGQSDKKKRPIVSIKRDTIKQLIAIKLAKGFHAGARGKLSISFEGKLRNDKRGVYLSKFSDGEHEYKHIVSHFQPTDARLVFPVFDEPRFKVPFQVRIVHPRGLTALGNTEVEFEKSIEDVSTVTAFKQTPPMPVHMLAFTVGQFDKPLELEAHSELGKRSYKVRVYTAPGLRESGQFALEVAQRSLQQFEHYIHHELPLTKFDIVAIADLDKDNTESYGLAFIRDSLVWIDDETKPDTKITTAVNVAHVCVHQWFGSLVSVAWWNDLWITEGVAAQFAFKIVREQYPQFESEYFVRLATLSGAMQLDAPGNQHALAPALSELRTSRQIHAIFDNVEFMKSASLAQMISLWMDSERDNWYQSALRKFVKVNAGKIVTRDDYMTAIEKSMHILPWRNPSGLFPLIENLISTFGSIRGVPLISAALDGERLRVGVELMHEARDARLVAGQSASSVMVYDDVFIEYTKEAKNNERFSFSPLINGFSSVCEWQLADKDVKWFKVSSQPDIETYSRTRYTDQLYAEFCEPIKRRTLSAMNRLQLLDDANALVKAQLIKNDTFRALLDCYADEHNGAVLLELMSALKTLASLETEDKSPSNANKAITNIYTNYGFAASEDATYLEQRMRQVGLKALITQGNQQVINSALKNFKQSKGQVALFLREPVYTAVVLHGTEAQAQQLMDKLQATKSYEEKVRLAGALSLSSDRKLLHQLWLWLSHKSGLKREVIKPIIDSIESK